MVSARCILCVPNEIVIGSLVDSDSGVIGTGKVRPWPPCWFGRFIASSYHSIRFTHERYRVFKKLRARGEVDLV